MSYNSELNSAEVNALIDAALAESNGTERMHGPLTAAGIDYFRQQGAYVRVCGEQVGCYVVTWKDERKADRATTPHPWGNYAALARKGAYLD